MDSHRAHIHDTRFALLRAAFAIGRCAAETATPPVRPEAGLTGEAGPTSSLGLLWALFRPGTTDTLPQVRRHWVRIGKINGSR